MAGFGFFVVGAIVVVVLAEGVVVVVVDVAATAPVVTNPTRASKAKRRAAVFIAISIVRVPPDPEVNVGP